MVWESEHVLAEGQYGFRQGRGCEGPTVQVQCLEMPKKSARKYMDPLGTSGVLLILSANHSYK